jgi:hypothetical protein
VGYEDDLNLYAYVGNDPFGGRDPTGQSCAPASEDEIVVCVTRPTMTWQQFQQVVGQFILATTRRAPPVLAFTAWSYQTPWSEADRCQDAPMDSGCGSGPTIHESEQTRGLWPGDRGAEEWGRRNNVDPDRARNRFHDIKQGDRSQGGGRGRDDYKVNPNTGDVVAPDGEIVGNLGE